MDNTDFQFDLELSQNEMYEMGEKCLHEVIKHIVALPEAPRSNLKNGVEVARALREGVPFKPESFNSLLQLLLEKVFPVSINTAHPDYLGYIPGGGLYPSALADFIASGLNRYVGVWYAGPALSRIETNVLEWIRELMDFPETTRGILTSGGSLANFSAIVTARKDKLGDDIGKGVMYASSQTHHSIMKAAMLAGIPEANIRLVETGKHFRAVPSLFETMIKKDLQEGMQPFLIVSNAGTTNSGTVDPLHELAGLAQKYNCWHHVDGAYGGFFYWCEQGKKKLAGISRADSLVLDPHKGLFVPYGSGCLLVKDGEKLRRAHMLTADYLQDTFTPDDECNFADYSPELSRSFRGLRIWLPLKLYGVTAFQENLAEKLALTKWMYRKFLQEPGFECMVKPDLTVITIRYIPKSGEVDAFNQRLQKAMIDSGRLFLSSTRLNGNYAIRICILSFRTHFEQVKGAFEAIVAHAKALETDLS